MILDEIAKKTKIRVEAAKQNFTGTDETDGGKGNGGYRLSV